jgi:hypothetical protein
VAVTEPVSQRAAVAPPPAAERGMGVTELRDQLVLKKEEEGALFCG